MSKAFFESTRVVQDGRLNRIFEPVIKGAMTKIPHYKNASMVASIMAKFNEGKAAPIISKEVGISRSEVQRIKMMNVPKLRKSVGGET
jgi:hypothetical protein